jgi:uncharacterized protein YdiU (UPF0061 family)
MSDPTSTSAIAGWRLEHSYASLPEAFHTAVKPTAVKLPTLVVFNHALARDLGLSASLMHEPEIFSGNRLPPGASPIAQAYAGHQFGGFTMLGDGRAILLGEQISPSGQRFDIQLKGPGPTPYSRRGDGRAALGPMLREYIISEAMHGLGIPSTRSLAVVGTGEAVYRQEVLPGAVLTRVAASHIRVGTFEYAAARDEPALIHALLHHTVARHYPELMGSEDLALRFLEAVIQRQASLIAQWMHVGFVHGVMNTDNMALSGESIDYGPCAFMDHYDPKTVFSSIDHHGRYAYGNQPTIAQWNLARLAESLLPALHPEEEAAVAIANDAINHFQSIFRERWLTGMRAKLGLFTQEPGDIDLIQALLEWMLATKADFTNTFCALTRQHALNESGEWTTQWQARLQRQPQTGGEVRSLMQSHNPAVIPRNHLVEQALEAASSRHDLQPFQDLMVALAHPYDHEKPRAPYTQPDSTGGASYQTFCGT